MAQLYTPKELAVITGGILKGNSPADLRPAFLLTDSRRLSFARSTVFFALKTSKNDGHKYIGELIDKGVACFVVSSGAIDQHWLQNACFILVDDTLKALQDVAAKHRSRFQCQVTAITGSNGKTIVKEWLSQLLAPQFRIVKNPRSYNSQTGVPLSVWNMDETHQMAIFEAGISKVGEMENLERIIKPHSGIFTNIGPAHDEGFSSTEEKIFEKLKLFSNCSLLIYCADQPLVKGCIRQWGTNHPNVELFSWGRAPGANLKVLSQSVHGDSCHINFQFKDTVHSIRVPFADKASIENVMHCMAFVMVHAFDPGQIIPQLLNLQPVAMRLEMKQAVNNCILVNDAYNSDLLSLGIALDFLHAHAKNRKRTLILSDIQQSGLPPGELYSRVKDLLIEKKIDRLFAVGPELCALQNVFRDLEAHFYKDTTSFLQQFNNREWVNEGILLKGAREFGFERIGQILQLKDHQTLLEINLDALVHNLNVYRTFLHPSTRIMAMVKAFSYGSGSHEIASMLQFHRVDYLAVAFADEGNDLRKAGITIPVVVLNPELHNLDVLFRFKLEPEIYSLNLLKRLISEVGNFPDHHAGNPFPVHLKVDTGMHRLGFMEEELDEMCQILKDCPAIKVESVFSHLAASDRSEFDAFTKLQVSRFEIMCEYISQSLGYSFIRHIANSAAISRFPDAHFDMVRVGIGLYGVDASPQIAELLQHVTTFRSVVSQVKNVKPGESVGYNRSAMLQRQTRVAIVPVGYADGLSRKLGNGNAYMLVGGQKAPTLGNISMDMCALDVTGLQVNEGDEVVIFGEHLPVEELARKMDTIPYEVFTSIPPRVKRIYFSE
ncbi:MAG: bifunctional UDP-N-acetylmuramoyl-tripeptide:D-alanyl-D-alanine ligase/alanine racemase [Bacteroidota bacterium]